MFKPTLIASAALAVGALTANVNAASIFFGEDFAINSTANLASATNALAAESGFASSLTGIGYEGFEGFADGTSAPLASIFSNGITATLTGSGNVDNNATGCCGRFAVDGTQYYEATGSFTLTFSDAVAAFGFWGTDIGDFNGQIVVELAGGGTQSFTVANTPNQANGGALFWGIIDTTNLFTSVTFGNTNTGTDYFGFDKFTIGNLQQVVNAPEPGTMGLLGLGLLGMAAARRRQKQA